MSTGLDTEWILRIVLFSIVHWVLAGVLVNDLSSRQRIFGRRKPPWAIIILFIPCFGSLLYLVFHPEILDPGLLKEKQNRDKDKKR
ncbi:MAG: hypothetical protein MUO90_00030 [Dehalococcoidales bacterium]|nr:hypothetical protein [Dehalococcoidales bacterium]